MPPPLILIRIGSGAAVVPQPGKATIADGVAGAASLSDEAVGATISDAAVGTATIGDDP